MILMFIILIWLIAATGFVEAIRQFLLQEKINELNIHAALVKDVEFCINQK